MARSPIVPLDVSDHRPAYLWHTSSGRQLKLSGSAYFLLSQRADGVSAEELAALLGERLGREVAPAEVEAALAAVDEQVAAIEGRRGRSAFGLWVRVPCLPAAVVNRLARLLAPMFHPLVTTVVGLGVVYTLAGRQALGAREITVMDDSVLWPAIGLITLSSLVHELGHAAACARFRAPVRTIGAGLYWIYPVFYTDVSQSWSLSRRQRLVVDVAGSYFQLVAAAGYLLWWRLTGWEPARIAALGAVPYALVMLVPIFKFDGYWLVSDMLGVANLSGQVRRALACVRDRMLRRPTAPLPWPGWVAAAVAAYGVFTVLFLAYFLTGLALTLTELAMSYPARVGGLVRDLVTPPHHPAAGRLHSLLFPSYTLFGGVLLIVALLRRVSAFGRRLTSLSGKRSS